MTNKKLAILGIVAAVMVVAVVIQSSLQDTKTDGGSSIRYLVQGLDTSRIGSIEIIGGENKTTLSKRNSGFTVNELDGYPAKLSQVNDIITKCLSIKVGRVYTSNPRNFEDLGVSEENARYVVRFNNADNELITGVVISDFTDGKSYVRRADSDNVYVADESIWLNASPSNFVEKQISNVQKSKIVEVAVDTGDTQYTILQDGGKAALQNVPEGKIAAQSECDRVFGAFTSLRFDDVKAASELKDLNFTGSYVVKLDDSTVYTAKLARKDDKVYAALSADFTDKTPVTVSRQATETEEELKKKEAKLLANEAANKYTQTHADWVYILPSHSSENLTKPLADLLEDAPEPEIVEEIQEAQEVEELEVEEQLVAEEGQE